MNTWFIFAIIFTIMAAICGYKGNAQESQKSSDNIESKITKLGQEIQEWQGNDSQAPTKQELREVEERYLELASDFHSSRHEKAATVAANVAKSKAHELENAQEIKLQYDRLFKASEQLAIAYTKGNSEQSIEITRTEMPSNIFEIKDGNSPQITFVFNDEISWAAEFTPTDGNAMVAIKFRSVDVKRAESDVDKFIEFSNGFLLTTIGERVAFVPLSGEHEQLISYITDNIPTENWENTDKYEEIALDLIRRLIEWNLLPDLSK